MASHIPPLPLLPRAPQSETGGPKHHFPYCHLEHPCATAEPCVEVRSHLPQEGNLMRVATGHGDIQCTAIWWGFLLCLGKLRPEVFQGSTTEAYRGDCFGFSEPVRMGFLGLRRSWGCISLASGESVFLYRSFLFLRMSAWWDNTGNHLSGWGLGS